MKKLPYLGFTVLAVSFAACAGGEAAEGGLSGAVTLDGSSTVFPIAAAMAEEFQIAHDNAVQVTVGTSGTGGGFQKFCNGETEVSNASRPIKPEEEEACAANGIEPIELTIAWDGLTVVTNPENDWATCLTVEELRRVWEPSSTLASWSEVRDGFPNEELILYGPDTDSGTFDYFTAAIVGEEDASRADYTASADDNVLVLGVSGDGGGLGYFGYSYYEENRDKLRSVEIDGGSGCVGPSRATIEDGSYTPLSRPMFMYVRRDALARDEVRAFVDFMFDNAEALIPETGYVPLSAADYDAGRAKVSMD
ncbi:MAG: PstS family phosphate ABC transporter substrate-binding protein [Gemmatimonadetes bacterium]|nr:PstS family phosphate ABC transporter substrate-binding protein [Gemmatimonadota bacterium]